MMKMLVNWKTTIAGVAVVVVALGHLLTALGNGDMSPVMHDVMAILAGLGLINAEDA